MVGDAFALCKCALRTMCGVLLLLGCSPARGPEAGPAPPPAVVTTADLSRRTVPIEAEFVASTAAVQSVEVHARVQGTLDHVYFKEGTLVHQGQLLFGLQRDKYVAALQAAQASLMKAAADLHKAQYTQPVVQAQAAVDAKRADLERANLAVERLTPLAASRAVPQKDLDNARSSQAAAKAALDGALAQLTDAKVEQSVGIEQAKAEVLSAQSQLTDARLNLSYTTIRAPVTGMAGFLTVDPGNVVGGAGDQVLTTISTVDPMKVTFPVDEVTYIRFVTTRNDPGQRALRDQPLHLELADNSIYPYPGRLYTLNRALDVKTGSIIVEARFPNPRALLRPGQYARVRIITTQRRDAVLVPQTAIVQTQGATSAYVIGGDGSAQLRSVTLGPQFGNAYVVDDGLRAGERVVVTGIQHVRPGAKVVIASGAAAGN